MTTMKTLTSSLILAGLLGGALAGSAQAQIHIEISGVGNNQIPTAIASFADENLAPQQVSAIIRADLERSGAFQIMDAGTISDTADVDYNAWKARGAAVVVGSVQQLANGSFVVRYKLLDTVKQAKISQLDVMTAPQYPRVSAHKIADDIYLKLTGVRGAFDTRIAYVTEENRKFKLKVADADGENIQEALSSPEPIISPSWSPTKKAATRRRRGRRTAASWPWRCPRTATPRSTSSTPPAAACTASPTADRKSVV